MDWVVTLPVMADCLPKDEIKLPFNIGGIIEHGHFNSVVFKPINKIICLRDLARNLSGADTRNTGNEFTKAVGLLVSLAAALAVSEYQHGDYKEPYIYVTPEQFEGNDEYIDYLVEHIADEYQDYICSYIFGRYFDVDDLDSVDANELYVLITSIINEMAILLRDNCPDILMVDEYQSKGLCDLKAKWGEEHIYVMFSPYPTETGELLRSIFEDIQKQYNPKGYEAWQQDNR